MIRLRRRISGYLTISALAVTAALAGALLGLSPAQAHTTTGTLFPTADGFYTAWSPGNWDELEETGTPNCGGGEFVPSNTSLQRESVVINLGGVPDGATITSVNVQSWHVGQSSTGGTYRNFARLDGNDTDSATENATSSTSGCTATTLQNINVTDTVKSGTTALEVGVVKTATNGGTVRVGAIRATVEYNRAPSTPTLLTPANGATTTDKTPTFDWDDSSDPDGSDGITYQIGRAPRVSGVCDWGSGTIDIVSGSTFTPGTDMSLGTHCWRVRALDHAGLASSFGSERTLTIKASVNAVITAADKEYDGTTNAGYTCDVTGEDSGDIVTCDGTHPATFDNKNVGTGKTVTATGLSLGGADAGDYVLTNSSDTDTADINKADPNCSIDGYTDSYDGGSHGATGTCAGVNGEGPLAGLDLGDSFTNAPGGTANWTFTDETGNYDDDSGAVSIVINKADPTCSIDGFTGPYDGNSHGADGSCTDINDEELAGLDLGETYTDVPGGTANWSFTDETGNYNDDSGSVEIVINKVDPTCSIDGFTGPYDGDSHGADGSCTGVDDEELAGLDLGETYTDVPGGTANWTFTDETGNYNDDSGSVEIEINKVDPTCSIDGFTGPYDGTSHGATGSCTGVDDEELDTLDLGETYTNAPGGTANWSFTSQSVNYNDDSGSVEIEINKADATCTIDGFTGPYDGNPHGADGSCTDINDDELDGLDLGETYTNVPGGTANWTFTDETGNYNDDSGSVEIEINKADATCSIDGFTGPYDGASHGATGSCTDINDDELAGLDLGDSFTNAPGGTANWSFTDETGNYNDDSGAVSIVINKADPTCSIDGFTGPYDGASHGATGSCTDINDDELDGLDLGDSFTNAPGGTANWSFTDETGNYNDDSGAVSIVINKADPTCSIDGFTGPYDGASHGATGSCTDINDDELDGLDLGDSFTNAPGGTANWSFTDETGNYNDDSGSVEIVINSVEVSAEITATSKTYDGLVDAEYTCDVVGEEDGDDVSCDGAHPATFDDPNVGTRTATATELELSGADAGNYTLGNTEDTDDADITKATLSVDADDQTKEFGEDDPELTYTLTGFITPDDENSVAIDGEGVCTRDPGETVLGGPYEITCTPGDLEADNYDFATGEPGELTITPDTSVPSVTINQGETQDDPTGDSPIVFDVVFSESVTGFADDDVELSGTAGATTASVDGSGAEYTVDVSGMTSSGTVIAAVKAAAATDGSNDSAASTSDDDTVQYDQPVTVFDPGPTATISGTPRVGTTLTAGEGSPLPTPDSFQYEWFADGIAIGGATNKTFTPTNAQVGKALTVKVTAVKDGFTPASDLSDPTGPVGTLPAKTIQVTTNGGAAYAGDRIAVSVLRLQPHEAYTVTFDGEVVKTGTANLLGNANFTMLVPLTKLPGSYIVEAVGSLADRKGTDTLVVKAPSALGVTLSKNSLPAGGTQRVTVTNLLNGEKVEVRLDGTLVSPASAVGNSVGGYSLNFPVGSTAGSRSVEVKGTYNGRTTTKTFTVTGP